MNNSKEIPNTFYRVSVKALILNESKEFLLAQEANGSWELLGGGLNHGEEPIDGLKREIMEETGLEVTSVVKKPSYFLTTKATTDTWIANIIYKITVKNLEFKKSDECIELRYFNRESLKEVSAFSNVIKFANLFNPTNYE